MLSPAVGPGTARSRSSPPSAQQPLLDAGYGMTAVREMFPYRTPAVLRDALLHGKVCAAGLRWGMSIRIGVSVPDESGASSRRSGGPRAGVETEVGCGSMFAPLFCTPAMMLVVERQSGPWFRLHVHSGNAWAGVDKEEALRRGRNDAPTDCCPIAHLILPLEEPTAAQSVEGYQGLEIDVADYANFVSSLVDTDEASPDAPEVCSTFLDRINTMFPLSPTVHPAAATGGVGFTLAAESATWQLSNNTALRDSADRPITDTRLVNTSEAVEPEAYPETDALIRAAALDDRHPPSTHRVIARGDLPVYLHFSRIPPPPEASASDVSGGSAPF